MRAAARAEYIVQCIRDSGSMYEADARAFLAEHDAHGRAEALAEVTAWLIKKAREFHVRSRKQERAQGDTCASLASQIARGAVRPNNVDMLPDAGFFEVGRTYEYRGDQFRVLAIDPHPTRGDLTAIGWLIETDGTCLVIRMTAGNWETGKWTEVAS